MGVCNSDSKEERRVYKEDNKDKIEKSKTKDNDIIMSGIIQPKLKKKGKNEDKKTNNSETEREDKNSGNNRKNEESITSINNKKMNESYNSISINEKNSKINQNKIDKSINNISRISNTDKISLNKDKDKDKDTNKDKDKDKDNDNDNDSENDNISFNKGVNNPTLNEIKMNNSKNEISYNNNSFRNNIINEKKSERNENKSERNENKSENYNENKSENKEDQINNINEENKEDQINNINEDNNNKYTLKASTQSNQNNITPEQQGKIFNKQSNNFEKKPEIENLNLPTNINNNNNEKDKMDENVNNINININNDNDKEKKYSNATPLQSYNEQMFKSNKNGENKKSENKSDDFERFEDEENINNNSQKVQIQNNNNNNNNIYQKNIKKYEDFNINSQYYLVCPKCEEHIPHIETVDYDDIENDFKITYICSCYDLDVSINEVYFRELINDAEPRNSCPNHSGSELIYFCKNCNKIICEKCKEEDHNSHRVENNYIISEENANKMIKIAEAKKDQFKGYDLLQKLYQTYMGKYYK